MMGKSDGSGPLSFGKTLRRHFITGILVLTPTAVTFWALYKLFIILDSLLGDFLRGEYIRPEGIPGMGFVALILLILLVGLLTNNFLGRRLLALWERMIGAIPLINRVYLAVKQISEAILANRETQFRRVVLVEYPRRGIHSLAFVVRPPAGVVGRTLGKGQVALFLPTTPNPTSGFFLIVPETDVIPLDLTVEEGLKLVISAGTVMPGEDLSGNLSAKAPVSDPDPSEPRSDA
ncbi:MAG: DUF502 domain-containing protein [Candidatus Eisenbacteria bacterium]|uniref:DUF502 domain-containing protein n=1 Tax=Eiseniibacteriota bacterium TaxID=2212470 RepID=A0A948RUH8_UNCEI|nr:DUF502 domain-containing protein [Candidatus Eisenbacteria bacterium]MBU2689702.1 DUF502 domain-containing protein [Candidatus Eisenbacteria bacterium]